MPYPDFGEVYADLLAYSELQAEELEKAKQAAPKGKTVTSEGRDDWNPGLNNE